VTVATHIVERGIVIIPIAAGRKKMAIKFFLLSFNRKRETAVRGNTLPILARKPLD